MRLTLPLFLLLSVAAQAQYDPASISSEFTTQKQRDGLRKMLHVRTIGNTYPQPVNRETEYQFQSACWAISQFQVYNDTVRSIFSRLLAAYGDTLAIETRRSFLEAMYAVNRRDLSVDMKRIAGTETDPRLFAMIQLWLVRAEPSRAAELRARALRFATDHPDSPVALALADHLNGRETGLPQVGDLFRYQRTHGQKLIYSFQHRNRDLPGLAVVQLEDGRFARDDKGKLIMVPQLARSASNLPYFLTNGNTPQGIYSILGIGVSRNNFIGPTPNLQLIMPNESYWASFFHEPMDTTDIAEAYKSLLPASWENHGGMQESFIAGKAGRTEIIAHGTTIDPAYFAGKKYYPVSPTLGCLCAREIWDPATGKLKESDQLKLVNAFLQTPGTKGYFMVIDALPANVEQLVADYEKGMR
jgi:hypothetical protein